MPVQTIKAVYQVAASARDIERIAHDIALEQTVEVPANLITVPAIAEEIVGRVEDIHAVEGSSHLFLIRIAYNLSLANFQIPQLLNLLYGNISIKKHIRLVDFDLPSEWLNRFRGPNFGIPGLRQILGVSGRPLLCTALKPRGSDTETLARMAREFVLGGGDIVKDDHNLVEDDLEAFRGRVSRIHQAVEKANQESGRYALYFPHVLAPKEALEDYFQFVVSSGIRGVLVSPFLIGLDCFRYFAAKYPLVFMAHPSFSGTFFHDPHHGISPGLLLGKIFRLLGADISVFPNSGGRFSFTEQDCRDITHRLRCPMMDIAPGFPAPAGGMQYENIPRMAEVYGREAIFLIGGALLNDSRNLVQSTQKFLRAIQDRFPHYKEESPAGRWQSSCEVSARSEFSNGVQKYLAFQRDFRWEGRPPAVYKATKDLPFKDVIRHELIGQHGEQTRFDLRYFEIGPHGFSSLEKHVHTHTIICVRGRGELQINDETIELKPFDIAYVPPLAVHQLRNRRSEPFGFFCIVDHERDKPMRP